MQRNATFILLLLALIHIQSAIGQNQRPSNQASGPSPATGQMGGGPAMPPQPSSFSALRKGTQLIDSGRLQEAASVFQDYCRSRPQDPTGYFWMGVCFDEMRNYPSAAQAYRDAITKAEQNSMDSTEIRTNLGNILLKQNDISGAIESFKRAIEVNPQYGLAHLNLARAYIAKNDFNSALTSLDRCRDLRFNARQVSYYRAKALLGLGRKDEAGSVIRQMLQDFPNGDAKNSIQQEFQSCFGGQ